MDTLRRAVRIGAVLSMSLLVTPPDWHDTASIARTDVSRQCQNVQLFVGLYWNPGAAARTTALVYCIHNRWSTPCTLLGYPYVALLDRRFHTISVRLFRGRSILPHAPIHPATLDAHHNAYFALAYTDVPVMGIPCHHVPYLLVLLPRDRLPIVIFSHEDSNPSAFVACGESISVSPVASNSHLQQMP